MISVIGKVIDEANQPLTNVRVIALADWFLTKEKVTKPVPVDGDGQFVLELESIDPAHAAAIAPVVPSFRVRVIDVVGRQLSEDKVLDGTVLNHNLNNITVHRAEAEGLLVTNKSGVADFVSEGNAIKLLIDGEEAFGRVAVEIENAQHSINMTQLFFGVPKFHPENEAIDPETNEPKEKAQLVFKFDETNPLNPIEPKPANEQLTFPRIGDQRPERLLLNSLVDPNKNTTVRILMNELALGLPEGLLWLIVLTPIAAVPVTFAGLPFASGLLSLIGIGVTFFPLYLAVTLGLAAYEFYKIRKTLDELEDVDILKSYFGSALPADAAKRLFVRGFKQKAPHNGVQHCKMVIVDNDRAVVLGSPFAQRYFDSLDHKIQEPRRGGNTADMVHDLSMAVVGPAARDLFKSFRLYWNEDLSGSEQLKELDENLPPNTQTSGEDDIAKLQVVRTLSGKRFDVLNKVSEKGILEGYLRAFAAAKHYIYLENQYFTDSVITDALVAALKANSKLQVIMVVPIKPDLPTYPKRQGKRIEQLREAGKDRVGVFTRWTYDKRESGRPWVAPVYIHAKGGIVDDSWATIGSANLDGLSLDYNLLLSPLVFGETTACELNLNLIPPSPGAVTKFAELMRRRLWSEHLGILDADKKKLNPEDASLKHPPNHDWLNQLWIPKAKDALKHVTNATREDLRGFVLEYPKEDGGCLDTPRKHLKALGVELKPSRAVIRPITGTRKFNFSTGKWDKMPEREDIKQ